MHHQESLPARHKLHRDRDRTPDQEQTAAALAEHEHVRPGLAREASQRSVNAQGEASSAALVQSVRSSSQESFHVAQHAQQPQRATQSQQRLLETQSQQRRLEFQSQQRQPAEDHGHEMEVWHTQKGSDNHESQSQRAQRDAQLDKQAQSAQRAQHAQHSMQSGFASSVTLSARVRQRSSSPQSGRSITSSCSAVLHSPEATTQVSFHTSVSPTKRAMPPVDSSSQLSIKASVSAGQQQCLPEQLHKHSLPQQRLPQQELPEQQQLPQQLPQQRLQLQSASGQQHLLTTDHKGQNPNSQGQSQQGFVFLPGQSTGTGQVRCPSRTSNTAPPSVAPQAGAAATTAAATATCQPDIQSPPAVGSGAAEPGCAGAEASGIQQRSGIRSDSAEAMSQEPSAFHTRQQHEAATKPSQPSVCDAAATHTQTQTLSSCGGLKGSGQPVSRTGSMDRLQKLMLLTSGAQQEQQQQQHRVSGAGAFSVNRSMSRTASMAVQHTSSCADSAGGPTQGKSSQIPGSPQRGVSRTGSVISQPQLTPSHADSASSHMCCSSSNSAQQAVSHAMGIALLQQQSQGALGVQPSYDDLSREGLEEDNCRLRYALAAIELQLGVLRNQQVNHEAQHSRGVQNADPS